MTFIKKIGLTTFLALAALCLGCDSEPAQPAGNTGQGTVQMGTGRFALQTMVAPARGWSGDALPVRMESTNLKGSDGHDGKANFWRALFASAGRQKPQPFTGPDEPLDARRK